MFGVARDTSTPSYKERDANDADPIALLNYVLRTSLGCLLRVWASPVPSTHSHSTQSGQQIDMLCSNASDRSGERRPIRSAAENRRTRRERRVPARTP